MTTTQTLVDNFVSATNTSVAIYAQCRRDVHTTFEDMRPYLAAVKEAGQALVAAGFKGLYTISFRVNNKATHAFFCTEERRDAAYAFLEWQNRSSFRALKVSKRMLSFVWGSAQLVPHSLVKCMHDCFFDPGHDARQRDMMQKLLDKATTAMASGCIVVFNFDACNFTEMCLVETRDLAEMVGHAMVVSAREENILSALRLEYRPYSQEDAAKCGTFIIDTMPGTAVDEMTETIAVDASVALGESDYPLSDDDDEDDEEDESNQEKED